MKMVRLAGRLLLLASVALAMVSCTPRIPETSTQATGTYYPELRWPIWLGVELECTLIIEPTPYGNKKTFKCRLKIGNFLQAMLAQVDDERKAAYIVEAPDEWQSPTGTGVFTTTDGITGTILISDTELFEPPERGPIITDPGYKTVVLSFADQESIPETDFDLDIPIDAHNFDATCFVLKGLVAIIHPPEGSSRERLEIPPEEVDPNFPAITDLDHVTPPLNCATPAPIVELASLASTVTIDRVLVTWDVTAEHNNAGFNLYRGSLPDGPATKLNDALIPSEGNPVQGASYQFTDIPGPGLFFYTLENVSHSGATTRYGPILATVGQQRYLPLLVQR